MQPKGAGLWLVTTSVTPRMTGFVPCCDMSARGHRTGWRSWPDQELDHLGSMSSSASTRTSTPTQPPWSMLRLVVSSTRSPSRRRPRAIPSWRSSPTTTRCCGPGPSRGTGGHCAGLGRHLLGSSEIVIELDREAGRAPRRRAVRPSRCDPRCARSDCPTAAGNSRHRGRTPSTVSAPGRPPLSDQCLHGSPYLRTMSFTRPDRNTLRTPCSKRARVPRLNRVGAERGKPSAEAAAPRRT